jgi:heme exporter protein D
VNPWNFVAAAYAVTLLAAAALAFASLVAMRRAERAIEDRDR